jgi:multiple sugar transport system substrate-binding protein
MVASTQPRLALGIVSSVLRAGTTRRQYLRAVTGVMAAAAATPLAACGIVRQSANSPTGQSTLRPVTIQWMYGPAANNERVRTTLEATAARFPKAYPGPKVETLHIPDAYYDKLQSMFASGTPPDLFWMQVRDFPAYVLRGNLQLIEPYARRDKYDLNDFLEPLQRQYRWGDGQLRGLPWDYGFQALFYNASLFRRAGIPLPPNRWDAPGWTFDDFRHAAQRLTVALGGGPPVVYGLVNPTRSYFPWIYANGGRLINVDNNATRLDAPESIGALQFIRDLMHRHHVSPPPSEFANTDPIKTFSAGRSAMVVSAAATATTQLRAVDDFEWDAAPMPAGPGLRRGERRTHGGGSGWVLARQGAHRDEAWALMKHITSKETVTDLARAGWSPPRLSVLDSKLWLDPETPPKAKAVMRDAFKVIVTNPQILTWDDFISGANKTLDELWADKITAKQAGETIAQTTQPAIDAHNRQVEKGIPTG